MYSWGHAEYGCLGRKEDRQHSSGVVPLDLPVSSYIMWFEHNAVIVNDGRVFSWGLLVMGVLVQPN